MNYNNDEKMEKRAKELALAFSGELVKAFTQSHRRPYRIFSSHSEEKRKYYDASFKIVPKDMLFKNMREYGLINNRIMDMIDHIYESARKSEIRDLFSYLMEDASARTMNISSVIGLFTGMSEQKAAHARYLMDKYEKADVVEVAKKVGNSIHAHPSGMKARYEEMLVVREIATSYEMRAMEKRNHAEAMTWLAAAEKGNGGRGV